MEILGPSWTHTWTIIMTSYPWWILMDNIFRIQINSGTVRSARPGRPGLSFRPHSPGLPQGHLGKSEDRTSCAVLPRQDITYLNQWGGHHSPQVPLVAVLMVLCGLVWSRCVLSLEMNMSWVWISNATNGPGLVCVWGKGWGCGSRLSTTPHSVSKPLRCSESPHVTLWSPFWDVHGAIETHIVEVKANMPRSSNHSSHFHHAEECSGNPEMRWIK